ncbi:hypothetical protein [Candidatus Symbiopectobacterium sp. NZEC135]|uniref:hypothetical protein n=1 Tax=Candidatus Symbiopectobacterium sp. NZEC135 TaxID=2820471 RepID=UPI0022269B96|nr:hypothetical protein [Candidatus Symbiopectobacterium sp. NZEC135]MCW2478123.1 hypothetical protein [Candidatus Symbiopectobacterium sp. NZEC135]
MARSLSTSDLQKLLKDFSEKIYVYGSTYNYYIDVIHEQEEIVFEDVITKQQYFSTQRNSIKVADRFQKSGSTIIYIVENIDDDLSGVINVYYRKVN